jgi:hypothetical protein
MNLELARVWILLTGQALNRGSVAFVLTASRLAEGPTVHSPMQGLLSRENIHRGLPGAEVKNELSSASAHHALSRRNIINHRELQRTWAEQFLLVYPTS